ncbi:MAG: LamG-like jellyroll fold domain-containing protein, partial [Bacteroidota bacterium]|nr:LamG-like jellyroll fold domain-containing protein [Bacteroidota bacterium]
DDGYTDIARSNIVRVQEGTTPATPPPIAEEGLVAHYPFDGDYTDYSGNGNDGIPKGSMAFTDAELGKGASFDGKSWIEVSDSDTLDLSNALTFSVWLYKQDAGTGGWAVVLSKGDTSALDSKSPYALLHSYDGKYPLICLVKNNYREMIGSTAKTDFGVWYLLTVTWDGADIKYYINGELKDTKGWIGTLPNSDSKLIIGSDPPGSTEYFKGVMDDLRIYDHALSGGEIKALYEGKESPAPSPTPAITSGKGDCNGDGKITSLDALCALHMAVGKRAEDLVMDVTGDGSVTRDDAKKILRIAVGLEKLP